MFCVSYITSHHMQVMLNTRWPGSVFRSLIYIGLSSSVKLITNLSLIVLDVVGKVFAVLWLKIYVLTYWLHF
jgi:hypothetical protein